MAWGPQGETKYERVDFKSREEFKTYILSPEFKWKSASYLADFAEMIRDGDEVYLENQSNNHSGFSRLVGRRKTGITYCYVLSSWMS